MTLAARGSELELHVGGGTASGISSGKDGGMSSFPLFLSFILLEALVLPKIEAACGLMIKGVKRH